MIRVILFLLIITGVSACDDDSYRLVYSSGFSFANYDYIVIGKPDSERTYTALYSLDVEFANLMSRYNMKVVGDKEFENLPTDQRKRTLFVRMSITSTGENNLFSVSFDDAVSGRIGASITATAEGNLFDNSDRTEVFESVSDIIIQALQKDKGLTITEDEVKKPAK